MPDHPSTNLSALLALLATTVAVPAQSATYTYSGTGATVGCSPVGPAVQHNAVGVPTLGSTFVVQVPKSNGQCFYLCNMSVLVTGFSDSQWGGIALPVPIGVQPCGQLRASLDLVQLMPFDPTFTAPPESVAMQIPPAQSLIGLTFYQQAINLQFLLGGWSATAFGNLGTGTIGL